MKTNTALEIANYIKQELVDDPDTNNKYLAITALASTSYGSTQIQIMVNTETGQWKAVDTDEIEELEYNGSQYDDETFAEAINYNKESN